MNYHGINVSESQIESFCKRWKIKEFSLFGSVLRDDFGPDSDVDVLVTFDSDNRWSLWDLIDMQDELKNMFGRDIDIVEKDAIRNPFRRQEILKTQKVVYAPTIR